MKQLDLLYQTILRWESFLERLSPITLIRWQRPHISPLFLCSITHAHTPAIHLNTREKVEKRHAIQPPNKYKRKSCVQLC